MKKNLLFILLAFSFAFFNKANAQVTLLNNNKSLSGYPVFANSIFLTSDVDSTLWTSDGTQSGTKQYAFNVKIDKNGGEGILNNKIYFAGIDAAHGSELWVTDGTAAGTKLVQDIQSGAANSTPDNFILFKNDLYFTATTTVLGDELYKISGANGSVSLFKDIYPGAGSAFGTQNIDIFFSNNNLLYFTANDGVHGSELWVSDGTAANTKMLADITPGIGDTQFGGFAHLGNEIIFSVETLNSTSFDLWKTDGATTSLIKSFKNSFSTDFLSFNNKIYFAGTDAATGTELWSTDGTTTTMVKDIEPGTGSSNPLLFGSVIINNHFIFSATTAANGYNLWSSDGTAANTVMVTNNSKDIGSFYQSLFTVLDYSKLINGGSGFLDDFYSSTALFNGFIFFSASGTNPNCPSCTEQLWKTNGTTAGTFLVKDYSGTNGPGLTGNYFYTKSGLYFGADDGSHGDEPWFSDGTSAGTQMVADVNPGVGKSSPDFSFIFKSNLYFTADNGDSPDGFTDLYKINATVSALPITLLNFKAALQPQDVKLDWTTVTEINSSHFVIQRSPDAVHFSDIATVNAAGNSSIERSYTYNDNQYLEAGSDVIYYRLQMLDIDGSYKYSGVLSVKLKAGVASLRIYPNPVHNQLSILFSSATANTNELRITDVNGKQVYHQAYGAGSASNLQNINVSGFAKGSYFIQLITDKESKIIKFVKQ
ncbi:MAG: T9SS type A sorting domain-containing protein [Bacteroidota bacterium]|nr:T9SS type A sorting domain-containing protein [Bacteroidota bacterium]